MASPYALDFSPVSNALQLGVRNRLAEREAAMAEERQGFARELHPLQVKAQQQTIEHTGKMQPLELRGKQLEIDQAREAAQQRKYQKALAFIDSQADNFDQLPPDQQAKHWETLRNSSLFDDEDRKIFADPTYKAAWDDPRAAFRMLKALGSKYRDALDKDALVATTGMNKAHAKLYEAQAEAAKDKGTVTGYKDRKQLTDVSQEMRKEFNALPVIKNYVDAQSAHDRLKSLVETSKGKTFGSGAGDIAMVFSFIKALDPTSVVQPGEQATARNAPGVTDQLLNTYNRLLSGEFLTDRTRADFLKVIESELKHRKEPAVGLGRRFRTIARESLINPDHVVDRVFGDVDLDGDGIADTRQPPPPPAFNPPPPSTVPLAPRQGNVAPERSVPKALPNQHEAVLGEARAAIAAGKDPAAVRARLQQLGIDPGRL